MISISKNAMDPSSLGSSQVKWMLSSTEFRCCRKDSLDDFLMMINVSSTNLFQRVGGVGAVDSALTSKSSMNRLANPILIIGVYIYLHTKCLVNIIY